MNDYETLVRICKRDFDERQQALLAEVSKWNPIVLDGGTIVLPSEEKSQIALVAHYDKVTGSYGYNDNGMSIVAILGLLGKLPKNVEVVFTNGEETGSTGAKEYIHKRGSDISRCVNLDVCGYGDTLYMDRMNWTKNDGVEAVTGNMPWNDGREFKINGIESVCVSTSEGTDFRNGIHQIWKTIHNNDLDNRLDVLNFDVLEKVRNAVEQLVKA